MTGLLKVIAICALVPTLCRCHTQFKVSDGHRAGEACEQCCAVTTRDHAWAEAEESVPGILLQPRVKPSLYYITGLKRQNAKVTTTFVHMLQNAAGDFRGSVLST